jgi:malate dehydrogenase (oxaloacetate-decarboxylating)(NADP+)
MLGMGKPVHIFQLGASVEMVNMAAIAVIDAQRKKKNKHSSK